MAPTLYYDNVCYGSTGAALIVQGGNVTVTGNVLIAPQLTWRGTPSAVPRRGRRAGRTVPALSRGQRDD